MREAKYLGVTIKQDLKWETHINNISKKANSTLGFLRRNLKVTSCSIKEKAYKSLVRPQVEYASPVWDPYLKKNIDQIEMVQRRAARFVVNRYRNTSSVGNMLQHLQWRSLADRRKDARLTMMYKIHHGEVAISSSQLAPVIRQTRHSHHLSMQTISCRTSVRKESFFPRTIKDWNSLPTKIISSESVSAFKLAISAHSY